MTGKKDQLKQLLEMADDGKSLYAEYKVKQGCWAIPNKMFGFLTAFGMIHILRSSCLKL